MYANEGNEKVATTDFRQWGVLHWLITSISKLVIWNQQHYFKDSEASLMRTGEKKLDI